MAKKAPEKNKAKPIRHGRVDLPPDEHHIVEIAARKNGLPVAAYMRMAVIQRARKDAARAGNEGED
jgi:hypothetical protein